MRYEDILPGIVKENSNKILLTVIDGVGGLPHRETGKTELETANIPVLDSFAERGSCGLLTPILNGITPGSGPGHTGLFGYDPIETQIGRGVLEGLGIGLDLGREDVAIRGNFATIDEKMIVLDRRAGRISTEENKKIVSLISTEIKEIDGVKIELYTVKEHRCVILLKGEGLSPEVSENDPQNTGMPLKRIKHLNIESEKTARVLAEFEKRVIALLQKVDTKVKCVLLRGISKFPQVETFSEKYKLKAACIAAYPMYKGISKVFGMDVIDAGETVKDELEALKSVYMDYNFFFLHIKKTDSYGEDGNFQGKVSVLEELDPQLNIIKGMNFESMAITGDHSTPAVLKGHSWHPVPCIINSPNCVPDDVKHFTERDCSKGILQKIYSRELMYVLMANALKFDKFGA